MTAAAIVLCGGRSSRMGRPKALLPWRGRPCVTHVVDVLREVVDEVVVVTSEELELPPLPARVVRDRAPGLGPLAGIREGLAHVEADRAFVTGTDSPLLSPEVVPTLLSFGGAAAPVVDGHVQVLSAVYPRSLGPVIEGLIAEGRMRPLFALEAAHYRAVHPEELPGALGLHGFNTPEAYLAAVRADCPRATACVELTGRARLASGESALEAPVGTLAEVLRSLPLELALMEGERVARPYLVALGGRDLVRDGSVPVGAGERVVVIDAQTGG